ncbi:MAG TPA: hypothetical protein VF552_10720 [Allosphingosinicella sp.]|jgi:hypothetical protein
MHLPSFLRLEPHPRWVFILFSLALGAATFALDEGYAQDTANYDQASSALIESGFAYGRLIRESGDVSTVGYSLFVTLLALLKLAFAEHWRVAALAINVAAVSATVAMIVSLGRRLQLGPVAGWCAVVLASLCHDMWHWSRYVITDPLFLFISFGAFTLAAHRLLGRQARWGPPWFAAVVATLARPTGIVVPAAVGAMHILSRSARTARSRAAAILSLLAGGVAATLVFGWIMQSPERWPTTIGAIHIRNASRDYHAGQVVWERLETYHAPPAALADFWLISLDRFVHFFAFAAQGFSTAHVVVQCLFFVPAYLLCAVFAVAVFRRGSGLPEGARDMGAAALVTIVFYAFFHAMIQVDFDWRYRLPILPVIILLASLGAAFLARSAPAIKRGWR